MPQNSSEVYAPMSDVRKFLGTPWSAQLLLLADIHQTWLIEGILPQLGRGLIVAQWKTGKSLLALQLAHSLASGTEFLGFGVGKPIRVHYIDGEVGPMVMRDRLVKMAEVYPGAAENLVITMFPREGVIPAVLAQGAGDVDLVIVDPAIKLGYSDENDNAVVRGALDRVSDIVMNDLGAATLVVHHTRKPSREPSEYQGANEARGASAFLDWVDGAMSMLKIGDEYRLQFVTRGVETPDPLILTRDSETLTYSIKGKVPPIADLVLEEVDRWQKEGHQGMPSKEELVHRLQPRLRRGRTTVLRMLGDIYNKHERD